MATPKTKDPVFFIRLTVPDRMYAQSLADEKGLPLSTWMRMVILERLAEERGK